MDYLAKPTVWLADLCVSQRQKGIEKSNIAPFFFEFVIGRQAYHPFEH
ncbi:hypothetical protein [Thalassococcus sp. S3]|nr:hypothetical protein [Thalassococcus sp. S3]